MHLCSLDASVSNKEKPFTLHIAVHMNTLAYISTSSRHEPLYMCAICISGKSGSSPYLSVHMHNTQHPTSSHMLASQFECEIGTDGVNSPLPHNCSHGYQGAPFSDLVTTAVGRDPDCWRCVHFTLRILPLTLLHIALEALLLPSNTGITQSLY